MVFIVPHRLRLDNAVEVKQKGLQAIDRGEREFDLSGLVDVDSSAVAVLLAWHRAARSCDARLTWQGAEKNLRSLAQLYGVDDLIGMNADQVGASPTLRR